MAMTTGTSMPSLAITQSSSSKPFGSVIFSVPFVLAILRGSVGSVELSVLFALLAFVSAVWTLLPG